MSQLKKSEKNLIQFVALRPLRIRHEAIGVFAVTSQRLNDLRKWAARIFVICPLQVWTRNRRHRLSFTVNSGTNNFLWCPLQLKMRVFWDVAPCSLVAVDPDDGGSTHLLKVGLLQQGYTALYSRRLSYLSYSPPWEPENSHPFSCSEVWSKWTVSTCIKPTASTYSVGLVRS
jgi:hypothetical protein